MQFHIKKSLGYRRGSFRDYSRESSRQTRSGALRVVLSALEHASVHEQALRLRPLGLQAVIVHPGRNGIMDPRAVAAAVDAETVLVSVMAVNNETGAVQPIGEIAEAVRAAHASGGRRILIHSDAAQGYGKIPFNPLALGIDAVSLSSHKIGGPRGAGALWLAPEVSVEVLSAGGGQESGMRPGTENLPGICGFAAAAEKRGTGMPRELAEAQEKAAFLVRELGKIPGIRFYPETRTQAPDPFSPYILCFGFPPLPGEVLVRHADSHGFLIGTGSACSSRKKNRTRVLESMGIRAEIALSAVRISFGPATPASDLERFAEYAAGEIPALLSGAAGARS